LGHQPRDFILLSLAIGYPLGKMKCGSITLDATAGSLPMAVLISMAAPSAFSITYSNLGTISTIFLSLFMYALGLGGGPKSFPG
jgi:putative transport protein